MKKLRDNSAGFSIVEIMIVLVVIGLVTTGIILAGTTLQRNSRNNARDSDVRLIASALRDFATANNGNLPAATDSYGVVQQGSSASFADDLNLGFYNSSNNRTKLDTADVVTQTEESNYIVNAQTTHGTNGISILHVSDELPDEDNIHIWVGYECPASLENIEGTAGKYSIANPNWGLGSATGPYPSKRSFVIVYRHEGTGNDLWRCSEFLN